LRSRIPAFVAAYPVAPLEPPTFVSNLSCHDTILYRSLVIAARDDGSMSDACVTAAR